MITAPLALCRCGEDYSRDQGQEQEDASRSLRLRLQAHSRRRVFVALVQSVIGTSHEHFAPFQKGGREKSRDRANDDFLEKSSLHGPFQEAGAVPPFSPKSPLPGLHNPEAEEQIRQRVGNRTGSQAARSVRHQVIERAADKSRDPIRPGMSEPEDKCYDHE